MRPTQAIKLTREYHLLTDNRNTTHVTNEVNLHRCISCGTYFVPSRQIDWAVERIEEKVSIYKEFGGDLKRAMEICSNCRREISNVRKAKNC